MSKMSFQRAAVNCKRCYEIAKQSKGHEDVNPENIVMGEDLGNARNEAMKALEQEIASNGVNLSDYLFDGSVRNLNNEAIFCLDLCYACDFKVPRIHHTYSKLLTKDRGINL